MPPGSREPIATATETWGWSLFAGCDDEPLQITGERAASDIKLVHSHREWAALQESVVSINNFKA